jgi:hypothetical protein
VSCAQLTEIASQSFPQINALAQGIEEVILKHEVSRGVTLLALCLALLSVSEDNEAPLHALTFAFDAAEKGHSLFEHWRASPGGLKH